MTKKIIIETDGQMDHWAGCSELEAGNILFWPKIPFQFPQEEIDFLLAQRQGGSASRKNISYKPQADRMSNHDAKDPASSERLKTILSQYSKRVSSYLTGILAPYVDQWKLDYASFRPFQEKGRKLRLRARNDLLHVDAFPTRPVHGWRILRFFTNINPEESRKWVTSLPFSELLKQFGGGKQGVSFPSAMNYSWAGRLWKKGKMALSSLGLKIPVRSPYDHFMLRLHHFLKENENFQKTCPKDHWDFPPNSCWAVFTDQVSHAALSGQYALEQTFLIPEKALLRPETSPAALLQGISGKNLIDVEYV